MSEKKPLQNIPYDKETRALAAAAHERGYSYKDISNNMGLSKGVLSNWLSKNKDKLYEDCGDMIEEMKNGLPDKYVFLQNQIAHSITQKDIDDASLVQKATAVGIFGDRYLKATGQVSDNMIVINNNINTKVSRIEKRNVEIQKLKTMLSEEGPTPQGET